jgi:hypothetical protein
MWSSSRGVGIALIAGGVLSKELAGMGSRAERRGGPAIGSPPARFTSLSRASRRSCDSPQPGLAVTADRGHAADGKHSRAAQPHVPKHVVPPDESATSSRSQPPKGAARRPHRTTYSEHITSPRPPTSFHATDVRVLEYSPGTRRALLRARYLSSKLLPAIVHG